MSNWAYLYGNRTGDPDEPFDASRDAVFVGANTIPVFWYVLFDAEDSCERRIEWAGGSSTLVPGLLVERAKGLARAAEREPVLFRYLPATLRPLFASFLSALASRECSHLQLDPCELAMLLKAAELADLHRKSMRAMSVDAEVQDLVLLFDRTSLDFDRGARLVHVRDPDSVAYDLLGGEW